MSLSQLRYFVAAAEEGSLGRAALRLHISQPPLTRQLRSLEDEIGAPLFERTRRGLRLLPSGEVFLQHARRILLAVDSAVAAARSATAFRPEAETPPRPPAHAPAAPEPNRGGGS